MEKTIRCPECGDNVFPEFDMCPVCSYKFSSFDYLQQGLNEEDFKGYGEINLSKGNLLGKIKIISFIVVILLIIFIFITK